MNRSKPFFKECNIWWWGGYYIPVRNSMSTIPKYTWSHLTEQEKERYEKDVGKKILYDHEFLDWYCQIHQME